MWSKIGAVTTIGYQYPPLECTTPTILHLPITIELISGWFIVLFTWIVIVKLINTIWGIPTIPVVAVGSAKLWFKFLPTNIPFDPLPNFAINSISIPLLTTSMLGSTIVSSLMVVIPALNDWVSFIPTCCFRVSTIIASNTIGEIVLTWNWHCSSLWLPIGILCGAICGCEYPSGYLLLVWIDERICQLCGPNWLPISMPPILF